MQLKPEEKMAILLELIPQDLSSHIVKFLTDEEISGVKRYNSLDIELEVKKKVINELFPGTINIEDMNDITGAITCIARDNPAKIALLIKSSLSGKTLTFNDIIITDMENLKKAEAILEEIKRKEKRADSMVEEAHNQVKKMTLKTQKKCDIMMEELKNKGAKLIDDAKNYRDKLIEETKHYCKKLMEEAEDIYEQNEPSDGEETRLKTREIIKESQEKAKAMIDGAKSYARQLHSFAKQEGFEYGKSLGIEAGKKEGNEILKEALKIKNYFVEERNKFFSTIDTQIAEMAFYVAEKIIKTEITADQNIVLTLIKDRLNEVQKEEDIILVVNPEDYEYVNIHESELRKVLANVKKFKIEKDEMIEKGGCIIGTTILDCSRIEFHLNTLKLLFEYEKNQSFLTERSSHV